MLTIETVLRDIAELDDYDRMQIFKVLKRDYCLDCGSAEPCDCYCSGDDEE